MNRSSINLLILSLIISSKGYAEDATFDGWARIDLFSSTRDLDRKFGAGSAEFGLKYRRDLNENNRLRLESKFYQDLRGDKNHVRFMDSYWQYHDEKIDLLRVGWQRISWGKADGLNPTDFFTPYDYTLLQPFEEDQRRAVPVIRADISITERQTVSVVGQPYLVVGDLPSPRKMQVDEEKPDGFRRPQVGARFSSTGGNVDWSVSVFRGFLNTPLFGAYQTGLYRHYSKLDGYGADVARNFGKWGFRAETAWLKPADTGTEGIRPFLYSVIGVDRGDDDWNVNFQLVSRYTPSYREPQEIHVNPYLNAAVRQNAINFGQLHSMQYGFTTRLSNQWFNQTLRGEILAIAYFNPGNALIRASMTYVISDSDTVSLGADYYIGPDGSFFGQQKSNRTAFLTYRHFF